MPGPDELSPDGRWKIRWRLTKEVLSPLETDLHFVAEVVNAITAKVLQAWKREEYGSSDGWQNFGVKSLSFTSDSSALTVMFEEGWVQSIPLPWPDEDEKRLAKTGRSAVSPAVKPAVSPAKLPRELP